MHSWVCFVVWFFIFLWNIELYLLLHYEYSRDQPVGVTSALTTRSLTGFLQWWEFKSFPGSWAKTFPQCYPCKSIQMFLPATVEIDSWTFFSDVSCLVSLRIKEAAFFTDEKTELKLSVCVPMRLCDPSAPAVPAAWRRRVSLAVWSCNQRLHHSSRSACDRPAAAADDWNTYTETRWTAGFSLGQLKHCGSATHALIHVGKL